MASSLIHLTKKRRHQTKKCWRLLKAVHFGYGEPMEKDDIKSDKAASRDGMLPDAVSPDTVRLNAEAGQSTKSRADIEAERRRDRAAAKLRENLSRRKQQVRARRAGQADETDGLPAAKMDES
jgi:hypothetical protein